MSVLAVIDSVVGGDPAPQQPASAPGRETSLDLGDARYPDARAPEAKPEEPTPEEPVAPRTPLRRLVGEKLMVRMTGTAPSASLLSRVRRGHVGGVVLFADNIGSADEVRALSEQLQAASRDGGGTGVFIAIDQEGGVVKRLQAGPPARSAPQIGATGSSDVAEREGTNTGAYLAQLGINIDFAPVVDTPATSGAFISDRAFGRDPELVGRLATSFATGLQNNGVAATAKHFPGLGSSATNTDNARAVIGASRAALDARPSRSSRRSAAESSS